MTGQEPASARARFALAAYFLLWFAGWLALALTLDHAPTSDNQEQLDWATHPALGYAKHPPLPTWILWLFERIFPAGLTLTCLLGALQVAVMLACVYAVGRLLLDPRRAWRAAVLCTFVNYYTLRIHYYNHNTVLLAVTALTLLTLVRALQSNRALDWSVLGLSWGAGMLCKYQMIVGIACNLLAVPLAPGGWRPRLRGLATATCVALLVFLPHALWLYANDFPPLHYALRFVGASLGAQARLIRVGAFEAHQLLRLLAMLLFLGLLTRLQRRSLPDTPAAAGPVTPAFSTRALALQAIGPLALMAALGLFAGADLEMPWGTAYLWAVPLWLLSRPGAARLAALPDLTWILSAGACQAVLLVGAIIDNLR